MGYSHYLSNTINKVDQFGNKAGLSPKWFKINDWGVQINYLQTKMFNYSNLSYFASILHKEFEVLISYPELGAMEMLSLVSKGQSFDEAAKIMEGLKTLRPQIAKSMLKECKSIKAKRFFLFIDEKHEHAWLKKFNLDKINIGSGKRVIMEDSTLNKKYSITVLTEYGQNVHAPRKSCEIIKILISRHLNRKADYQLLLRLKDCFFPCLFFPVSSSSFSGVE